MTANTITSVVLTAVLIGAAVLRFLPHEGSIRASAAANEPPYPVVSVDRAHFQTIESVTFQPPWCSQPVDVLFIPAYLSSIDIRALSRSDDKFAVYYFYAGRRLPSIGIGPLLTAMHFFYRLAGSLQLAPETAANAYALELFVPVYCQAGVEKQLPQLGGLLATLHGAVDRR